MQRVRLELLQLPLYQPSPITTLTQKTWIKLTSPLSLYPASVLGLAMVARGEIGCLIASLAESKGIFVQAGVESTDEHSSDIYLIIVWAITLCTLQAPITVGLLVRRVKKSQASKRKGAEALDPLGSR